MGEIGSRLRAAREAAGLSLSALARRGNYSKPYLGLVETGRRAATPAIVAAYERALGVGLDGEVDNVDRRSFLTAAAVTALAPTFVTDGLVASVAGRDPGPLVAVQTSYHQDMAAASLLDRASIRSLVGWMRDGEAPVLRVNAAGILAKLPGQGWAQGVVDVLSRDVEVSGRYMTAVTARVLGTDWPTASVWVRDPCRHPQPRLAAERFAREAVNPRDVGARWCSAALLQRLTPALGGTP